MSKTVAALAAAACLVLALALALLARDVLRWPDAIAAGDVRYRVEPRSDALWRADEALPGDGARRLLDVGDDLAFREALRALRVGGVQEPQVSDPRLTLLRNEARARLAAVAASDPDPRRRSRALGLVGVISLASAYADVEDATPLLRDALVRFRGAIALDPRNDEAKVNLELAMRRGREAAAGGGGQRPTPGGEGAAGAGTKESGSGY